MDLSLTEEQLALRDMAADVFAKLYPPSRLRQLWSGSERTLDAWRQLAGVGLTGLGVDEAHGGSGGGTVDCAVMLERAGRACVPEPLLDTVGIAAPVLTRSTSTALRQRWLPAIARGDAIVSVQLAQQPFAADADVADLLLVEVDGNLHAVASDGFLATRVPTEDPSRRLFHVDHDVGEPIGGAGVAADLAAVGTAAMLNGIAGALLDQTVEYVGLRQQFGQPVGAFQALQHKLASAHALLESSRAATLLAANAMDTDDADLTLAAAAAKVLAVDAHALANTHALQCHGGIGFTWEHDLHLWLKRGLALAQAYGPPTADRAAIAARLLDDRSDVS